MRLQVSLRTPARISWFSALQVMLLLVWLSWGMMVTVLVLVVPSLEAGEYTEPATKFIVLVRWGNILLESHWLVIM